MDGFGFSNIAAHNGWGMAIVGYITVICALAVLATLISFMPKIVIIQQGLANIFFRKNKSVKAEVKTAAQPTVKPGELDVGILTGEYAVLAGDLAAPFKLADLYTKAGEAGLAHPYLSVTLLREEGKIVPAEEEGLFIFA